MPTETTTTTRRDFLGRSLRAGAAAAVIPSLAIAATPAATAQERFDEAYAALAQAMDEIAGPGGWQLHGGRNADGEVWAVRVKIVHDRLPIFPGRPDGPTMLVQRGVNIDHPYLPA